MHEIPEAPVSHLQGRAGAQNPGGRLSLDGESLEMQALPLSHLVHAKRGVDALLQNFTSCRTLSGSSWLIYSENLC